ncbi:G-protein coupled receptor family C group 5 member D [Aplochiton taeniatus]
MWTDKARTPTLWFLLLSSWVPRPGLCQTNQTGAGNSVLPPGTAGNTTTTGTSSAPTPSPRTDASANYTSQDATVAPGCGPGLAPEYRYLCDRRAAWGIVMESLASLGFVVSACLLGGLLVWALWLCVPPRRRRTGQGGAQASACLYLLATAGVFALTFAFVIGQTTRTCPTRLFLFGVLFALAFSCLLARGLALLGFAVARGWGEPALALGLSLVQVVIAAEWLLVVLVRDGRPCQCSQAEFVMLLIYVLCLLAVGLALALRCLCRACTTHGYGGGGTQRQNRREAAVLCLTLLLSAAVWVVWVALLTRGNPDLGRRPQWDDPVLSVTLVAHAWVLLLGHGLAQVAFLCRGAGRSKDEPLSFSGWASPGGAMQGLEGPKEGTDNRSFENDNGKRKGKRADPAVRSPYESGFSMTEIDPAKDYTIPRPQTTNIGEPYDEYYGRSLSP